MKGVPIVPIQYEALFVAHESLEARTAHHACWPTEFPLTICGVIADVSPNPTSANGDVAMWIDCEACRSQMRAGLAPTRTNPHLS